MFRHEGSLVAISNQSQCVKTKQNKTKTPPQKYGSSWYGTSTKACLAWHETTLTVSLYTMISTLKPSIYSVLQQKIFCPTVRRRQVSNLMISVTRGWEVREQNWARSPLSCLSIIAPAANRRNPVCRKGRIMLSSCCDAYEQQFEKMWMGGLGGCTLPSGSRHMI